MVNSELFGVYFTANYLQVYFCFVILTPLIRIIPNVLTLYNYTVQTKLIAVVNDYPVLLFYYTACISRHITILEIYINAQYFHCLILLIKIRSCHVYKNTFEYLQSWSFGKDLNRHCLMSDPIMYWLYFLKMVILKVNMYTTRLPCRRYGSCQYSLWGRDTLWTK